MFRQRGAPKRVRKNHTLRAIAVTLAQARENIGGRQPPEPPRVQAGFIHVICLGISNIYIHFSTAYTFLRANSSYRPPYYLLPHAFSPWTYILLYCSTWKSDIISIDLHRKRQQNGGGIHPGSSVTFSPPGILTHRPSSQIWAPSVLLPCHVMCIFVCVFYGICGYIGGGFYLFIYFSIYLFILYLWLL